MAKLFFLFSGEHNFLPTSELKSILEAERHPYKILEKFDQTLRLEVDLTCIDAVKRRAALTRLCGLELFTCEAEMNTIMRMVRSTNLENVLSSEESFAVRIKRVKNYSSKIDMMALERKLGGLIKEKGELKVNLKNPDKTFTGILTNEKFVFGVKIAEVLPKPFFERRPKNKPFFHPSAMPAKLARCMVNLAKPAVGDLVFDPFCGTGSLLIEAALIGCRVLGSDIQRCMARGSLKNLVNFKIKPEGIIVADARNLPVKRVDCIVTDPPYGISAKTFKRTTAQIIKEVLTCASDILSRGRFICMAAPKTLKIGQAATELGYKHLESHFVYVHRSLTREIAVFEKV